MNWGSVKDFLKGKDPAALDGFVPSPVYRNPGLEYRRDTNAIPKGIGQIAGYRNTYWPVETYGVRRDRPGNYVIAFTGAGSGVDSDEGWRWATDDLDRRYGKGNYAVFTPRQTAQATRFINSLPQGSTIHVTGHSQGGGAAIDVLNGIRNRPDDFIHSVHLYDPVALNPGTAPVQPDKSYANRVRNFLPSAITPYNRGSDIYADLGGRYGDIEGADNRTARRDHHTIWGYGRQVADPPVANVWSDYPDDVMWPLVDTPVDEMSPYDLLTVVPKDRPWKAPRPQRAVGKLYDPVADSYRYVDNVNGNSGYLRAGTGVVPSVDIANPDTWMKSFGIPAQTPGSDSYFTYYRDAGTDSALSNAKASTPFSKGFFDIVRNITTPSNPSIPSELLGGRDPRRLEKEVSGRIERQMEDLLMHQSPRDALTGYGYLLGNLQRDVNNLYGRAQMAWMQGDRRNARNLARAAALSQTVLNRTVETLNRKFGSMTNPDGSSSIRDYRYDLPRVDDRQRMRMILTHGGFK